MPPRLYLDYAEIGANIRAEREKHGMSQRALGEELGFCYQSISFYENGDVKPSLETLLRLCLLFNIKTRQAGNDTLRRSDTMTFKAELYKQRLSTLRRERGRIRTLQCLSYELKQACLKFYDDEIEWHENALEEELSR